MRALVLFLVLPAAGLAACGGYRTRSPAHAASPGCTVDGTAVDVGADRLDEAPIVIAYVRHSFQPPDLVAVWADGTMVMSRELGRERVQGTVAAADATRVAREVAAGLARAPDYAELPGPTDQPRVELIARDGARWRHALVWGASPASYGRAPEGFVAAYRSLLSLHPASTGPFQPAELSVAWAPVELGPYAPIPWPADVPEPSPAETSSTLDARYDAQLRALVEASSGQMPPHPVSFANRTWSIHVVRRFRGEHVIERVLRCAASAEQRAVD